MSCHHVTDKFKPTAKFKHDHKFKFKYVIKFEYGRTFITTETTTDKGQVQMHRGPLDLPDRPRRVHAAFATRNEN